MSKITLKGLQKEFNRNIFADAKSEIFLNGIKERKEEVGQVLSIDYPEIVEVGKYTLEELSAWVEVAWNSVRVQYEDDRFDGTYRLTIKDKDGAIVNSKNEYRLISSEMVWFGDELFTDYRDLALDTYYITKREDAFVIFTPNFKQRDALVKKENTVEVIDQQAANYLFEKWFHKRVDAYRKDAETYVNLGKAMLKKLQSYAEEKNINLAESQFLFLDRDAIIFQYIGKQLSEIYGLDPKQFKALMSPHDLEKAIREENEIVFEAIHAGLPIEGVNSKPVAAGDDLPSEGEYMVLPDRPEQMIASTLRDRSKNNHEMLSTYETYLKEEKIRDKHLFVIDGWVMGTTTTIAKSLLQHFLPGADIHTWLIYGEDKTKHYRDFTVSGGGVIATHNFLERRPKFSKRLLSLQKDKNGKIYEKRWPSITYDKNDPNLDRRTLSLKLALDRNEPLHAKVFGMILKREIEHAKLDRHDKYKNARTHIIRERTIMHEKLYRL